MPERCNLTDCANSTSDIFDRDYDAFAYCCSEHQFMHAGEQAERERMAPLVDDLINALSSMQSHLARKGDRTFTGVNRLITNARAELSAGDVMARGQ